MTPELLAGHDELGRRLRARADCHVGGNTACADLVGFNADGTRWIRRWRRSGCLATGRRSSGWR